MTDEQRLDRLERIVKLMVKAGLRARQEARERAREHDEKINILISSQIRTDEKMAELAVAQKVTEQKVQSLADSVDRIINERRNGQP
jgi:hypothetical protein